MKNLHPLSRQYCKSSYPYGEVKRFFELILDMFLSGAKGRTPSIKATRVIEVMYSNIFEEYEE